IAIDRTTASEFLSQNINNKILVSNASTLLFEWGYLGGKSYIICTKDQQETIKTFLDVAQIKPCSSIEELMFAIENDEDYISESSCSKVMAFPKDCDLLPNEIN